MKIRNFFKKKLTTWISKSSLRLYYFIGRYQSLVIRISMVTAEASLGTE